MKSGRISDISVFPTALLLKVYKEDQQHLYYPETYYNYSLGPHPARPTESETAIEQAPQEIHVHIKVWEALFYNTN